MDTHRVSTALLVLLGSAALWACSPSSTSPEGRAGSLVIQPAEARLAAVGDSVRFRAFVSRADGGLTPVSPEWSSSAPSVVRIDSGGWARALALGRASIEADHSGAVAVATLRVNPDTLAPALETVFASPTRVVLRGAPVLVRVQAEFVDQGQVSQALAFFRGPLGAGVTGLVTMQLVEERAGPDDTLLSVWEGFLEIPGQVGAGTWALDGLTAEDRAGNVRRWGTDELKEQGFEVEVVATLGG